MCSVCVFVVFSNAASVGECTADCHGYEAAGDRELAAEISH